MSKYNPYPVTPAVVFPDRPEWPTYEAPPKWYVRPIEHTTTKR